MTIEAEIASSGRSRTHGQPTDGRSVAATSTKPSERRSSPPRTSGWCGPARPNGGISSTRPSQSSTRRRHGRPRRSKRSFVSGPPCSAQSAGSSRRETAATLDVWDIRLDEPGPRWSRPARHWSPSWLPMAAEHYSRLAGRRRPSGLDYRRSWSGPASRRLGASHAPATSNGESTSVGPHRDELELSIGGLAGRTHASQGEQRSLALALRLAAHQLATERLERPRCSSWTTSSPSSTPSGPGRCWPAFPRDRPC